MSESEKGSQVLGSERTKSRIPKSLVNGVCAQEPAGSTHHFPTVKYPARHLDVYFVTKDRLKRIDLANIGFAHPEDRSIFQEILRKQKWEVVSRELDFTVGDHRKMHAIISLAAQFGFPESGFMVSPAAYYRAYGIIPTKSKRGKQYKGREAEYARENLFSGGGANPVPIVYVPVDPRTNEKQYAVVAHRPLYSVVEIYPDMSPEDVDKLPENLRKYRRTRRVLWYIQLNPLLIRDHLTYYKLADNEFYSRLKEGVRKVRGPKARLTKYHINLYLWLLKQGRSVVPLPSDSMFAQSILKMRKNTIAKTLKYVSKKIHEILLIFKVAGYISEFRHTRLQTGEERWRLWLNRDRFPSLSKKEVTDPNQ